MDWAVDLVAIGGNLAPAAWNGIPFWMIDSRHETGRRVHRYFFPGRDATVYQDLGAFDGPMRIQGLIVGDFSVSDAQALEAAFRTPGPGVLVHPWLGTLQMVLVKPASFRFSQGRLRTVTIEAELAPFYPATPATPSTLDALALAWAEGTAAAQQFLVQALAPVAVGLLALDGIAGYLGAAFTLWQQITSAGSPTLSSRGVPPQAGNTLAAEVAPALAALAGGVVLPLSGPPGASVAPLLLAPAAAVLAASTATTTPVVGAGPLATAATPLDGRLTAQVLLSAASALPAPGGAPAPTVLAGVVSVAGAAMAAAQALSTITWTSAEEAQALGGEVLAALQAAASLVVSNVAYAPLAGGLLWRAIERVATALAADLSALVGRLPTVVNIVTPATLSVWEIAEMLVGDTPSLVLPMVSDLVARNAITDPGAVPGGVLQVLARPGQVLGA